MKKFKYILALLILGGFQACDDYVDITPRGNAIATTLEDVDLLLNDANSFEGNGLADGYRFEIPILINDNIEMREEDISNIDALSNSSLSRIYRLDDLFFSEVEVDEFWRQSYKKIGNMNYVLEVLDGIPGESADKDHYRGEALTRRALFYFLLVNVYGQHYGLANAAEAGSGVPIVTVFGDESVSLDRRSVNEVYSFIMNDLETAEGLLRAGRTNLARVNLAACQALLARVNLHMGNYDAALNYANQALSFNSTLINYATLPPDLFGNLATPIGLDNPEHVLMGQAGVPNTSTGSANVIFGRLSTELTALYSPFADLRLRLTGIDFEDFSYIYGLFNFFLVRHAVGVTVPELMLIKAESLARSGDIAGAMEEVNMLRANRYSSAFVAIGAHLLTAASQAEALSHVIDERRREFHVNGMRFFDIKRLNAQDNVGISLTRGTTTYSANGANWAVPIDPNVVATSNGQIAQNPRE